MKELITEYGFNYACFCTFFGQLGAVISGSAALSTYLSANNLPSFTPGDIDIWVQPPPLLRTADYVGFTNKILSFFTDFKYACKSIKTKDDTDYSYITSTSNQRNIECVMTFVSENNRNAQVQVIWVSTDPYTAIDTGFDLSCCTVLWCPKKKTWWTCEFETIERREMYLLHKSLNTEKHKARIAKYEARGFRLRPGPPPPIMFRRDPRRFHTDPKLTAYDIITLEELDVKQFVEAYDNNIVIKCGKNYYAYNREYITDYIEEHRFNRAHKKYSALPTRTIIEYPDGATHYADWSIYICKPIPTDNRVSVLSPYTVEQFEEHLLSE